MTSDAVIPKVKPTNIAKVLKLKRKIHDDLGLLCFLGDALTPAQLQSFTDTLMQILPQGILRSVVLESCVHLTFRPVTANELRQLAWRLAGNTDRLLNNLAVYEWVSQSEPEWMPMQVVDMRLLRNRQSEIVAEYTFRILSGTGASCLVKKVFNRRTCAAVAKELGFPRRRNNPNGKKLLPYFKEFSDFIGLRLYGLFSPELSVSTLKFWHMSCSSSLKTYNRNLLKKRARIGAFKCPFDYTHACNRCPVGYDKCSAATHPRSYTLGHCSVCDSESWFDKHISEHSCVDCATRARLRTDH